MNFKRTLLISFVASVALWALFSWPLPRYFFSGIPAAAHPEAADVQVMIPGDHLQFLYHCWLAGDMMAGNTPLFHNLYEFNTGNDLERFQPGTYFLPFSLVYALGSWLGGRPACSAMRPPTPARNASHSDAGGSLCEALRAGSIAGRPACNATCPQRYTQCCGRVRSIAGRAFGWNLMGFISIWLTFLMTWLLTRRYTPSEWISGLSAVVAVALPFRWICLLGGSPTGLAMMWVPMVWLGVDLAVREYSVRGGMLAGLAILFACWTDTHVFFFSVLTIPVWCLMALISRGQWAWNRPEVYPRLLRAFLPVIALTALALLFPSMMKWLAQFKTGFPQGADMVGKRALEEIRLYSPHWKSLFTWHGPGASDQIYIGYSSLLVLAAGGFALLLACAREWKRAWRSLLILALLGIGIAGIGALAMGTRGPAQGALLKFCRLVIPPYGMVRQPAKIFCLMPSFLAVGLAVSLAALVGPVRKKGWGGIAAALCVLLVVTEYALRVHPTICILEERQDAYASVAKNAEAEGTVARALILPLWPGDSHYSSVYQYFASLYRIRMVNGYAPLVKQDYFDNVFRRFESVNQGDLSDDQIEALREMGVNAIMVHEDMFPEKVSPFPVTFTLKQLLNHPRLRLLKQDGRVWAFKILTTPVEKDEVAHWNIFGSARRWEAESCRAEHAVSVKDPAAGGNEFIRLAEPGARMCTGGIGVSRAPDLKWLVRVRGEGTLSALLMTEDRVSGRIELPVQAPDWTWLNIPVTNHSAYSAISLELERQGGAVDLDTLLLSAGGWESPEPGQTLSVPAPCFFHAGYINRDRDSVVLLTSHDPNAFVFYGPKLPLEKGVYEIELVFRSDAPDGTPLGQFNIRRRAGDPEQWTLVKAGKRAVARFVQDENLVMHLEFAFFRNADMEIDRVVFKRSTSD